MIRKIFSTFTIRFASALLNLLIAIIISQYLGASGKGEQGIILATIAIIILFDNIVGGASVVYLTPRLKFQNIIKASYLWALLVSVTTFILLYFTNFVTSNHVLPIASLSFLCSLTSINSSILIGKEEINKSNALNFIIPFITIFVLFISFTFDISKSVNTYISALYIAYGGSFTLSFFFLKKEFLNRNNTHLTESFSKALGMLFKYGAQNQMSHIFQLLSFRLSYYVLEYYWDKAHVGVYSNGVSIIESVWMISSSITLYQYSRIVNTTDNKYAVGLTEMLTKYGILIAFIAILPIVMLPSGVYTWIFGSEFSQLNKLIILLAPGVWVFNYALIIGHYFSGIGKYYINTIASAVGLLVTIPLLLLLVPHYHIYGAAAVASISYFCTSVVVLIYFKKHGGKAILIPGIHEFKTIQNQILKILKKTSNEQS